MENKMKAACYQGIKDITCEEVGKPEISEPLDIIIKVKACGICGSDLHSYNLGLFPMISIETPKGRIPGHEFSGDVVEVGEGVEGIEIGDRLTGLAMGGMAEYVRIQNSVLGLTVYKIPNGVSYEEAATIEPLSGSLHTARKGKPADGQTIVVIGAGVIGLGIVQCLKAMVNLKDLIVVDVSDKRLGMAKQMGATVVINAAKEDLYEKVTSAAGSQPVKVMPGATAPLVDIVYDAVGYYAEKPGVPVFQQALHIVKEEGKIVVVGVFEADVTLDLTDLVVKQVNVTGSYFYTPDDVTDSIEFIRAKKIDRRSLISHEFSIDRCKEAFETQVNIDGSLKVLIKP
jgi:threonine dehydrogenase-like Zn-dependent dehydrogenase